MKFKLLTFVVATAVVSSASAGVFTIGGFKFDEKNSVTTAYIAEGRSLNAHTSTRFGRFSEDYVTNTALRENTFDKFDRSKSIARLMGKKNAKGYDYARYISLPDANDAPPSPNKERSVLELAWGTGSGLKNGAGNDFVVFEMASWEGFMVAVEKAGAKEFTPYRYQFANSKDSINDANAVAFDLSDFGVADGEMITAIRIRNIFNSRAAAGADKVDNASGQGNIVTPGDSGYDKAFTLCQKPGGTEFPETSLGADIVYVVGLHDIEAVKIVEAAPEPEPAPAPTASSTNVPAATNSVTAKK